MREKSRNIHLLILCLILLSLSVLFYFVHYLIFRDIHHIFLYLIGDIAFVPIEVLLVSVIIQRLLEERDKRAMLRKLNMVIGVFFSEVGTDMLRYFKDFQTDAAQKSDILVDGNWKPQDFEKISKAIKNIDYAMDSQTGDLKGLREFVMAKREFLLGLLENPNLLEHDMFTETLWAVFHLADELGHRKKVDGLSQKDYEHLSGDIKRVYRLLIRQWLDYLQHLKSDYPYLFSLAIRNNPFNPNSHIEIE